MADGRVARGARTRLAVLDTAVALSSVYGLDAMSLARLADETGISKSGLFTHWPDKEILQLAIVEHAVRQWTDEIVTPALAMPRGVRRLWALHEGRLAYYTSRALPGGCFFVASRAEFDDSPRGVVMLSPIAIDAWRHFASARRKQAVELVSSARTRTRCSLLSRSTPRRRAPSRLLPPLSSRGAAASSAPCSTGLRVLMNSLHLRTWWPPREKARRRPSAAQPPPPPLSSWATAANIWVGKGWTGKLWPLRPVPEARSPAYRARQARPPNPRLAQLQGTVLRRQGKFADQLIRLLDHWGRLGSMYKLRIDHWGTRACRMVLGAVGRTTPSRTGRVPGAGPARPWHAPPGGDRPRAALGAGTAGAGNG